MVDLQGKVAFVTGGGTGIGRAVAIGFAKAGARVAVMGRRREPLVETVDAIEGLGGTALPITGDVSIEDDVRGAIEQTVAEFGRLDHACNNAGIIGDLDPLLDLSVDSLDTVLGVNLRGPFLGMKYEIPEMRKVGGGAIVNVSSLNATKAEARASAYCASKAGLEMLSRTAALEHAKDGIRINSLRAGFFLTPMHDQALEAEGGATPELIAEIEGLVPLGRRGDPAEAAAAVLWLCSDFSSYVTGTELTIDGGLSAL
jgi:NAD(P)-dependent dehydrogenase (short-subunit alcohol dehydrogenase family)